MEWERVTAAPPGKKKTASTGLLAQEHPSATAPAPATTAGAAEAASPPPAGASFGPYGTATAPADSSPATKSWSVPGGKYYKATKEFLFGMRA